MMRMSRVGAAVLALAASGYLFAENSPDPNPAAADPETAAEAPAPPSRPRTWLAPEGSLVVNLPSDQSLARGLLQFLVTHRFRAPVRGSDSHSLYSLDSGAEFGFGLAYAPIERGEVALYRSGLQDDWELSAKYAFLPPGHCFGAAVRIGGDERRAPLRVLDSGTLVHDGKTKTSFFAQTVLTLHLLNNRVELSAVPTYSSRTTAERRAFNVPVHAAIALGRSWNLQGEYQAQRKSVPDSIGIWTIALEKVLFRHRFALVVSNTTVTTVDQYLSGDFAASPKRFGRAFDNGFRNDDWHIGFNLIRQFKP